MSFHTCAKFYCIVWQEKSDEETVANILDYLLKRSDEDFLNFWRSLVESGQGHVVDKYFPGYRTAGMLVITVYDNVILWTVQSITVQSYIINL